MLGGMGEVLTGVQTKFMQCAEEKYRAQKQLEAQSLPVNNVVAEGMQNEFIAILNAMYVRGMVTCTKKEFIQRMANAVGCPQMANNYSGQLHKIKTTIKYDEIFKSLSAAAQKEIEE